MLATFQPGSVATGKPSSASPSDRCTDKATSGPCWVNTATSDSPSPSKSPRAVLVVAVGYVVATSCGALGVVTAVPEAAVSQRQKALRPPPVSANVVTSALPSPVASPAVRAVAGAALALNLYVPSAPACPARSLAR